jgi:hypothetical protein
LARSSDSSDVQVTRWQAILDRTFPDGAICSWRHPGGSDFPVSYRVSRLEVTGMAGLDPMVTGSDSGSGRVFGPWRVTSYAKQPGGLYEVRFDNIEETMTWSTRVTPQLAALLRADRELRIAQAPHGGRAVLFGEPEL